MAATHAMTPAKTQFVSLSSFDKTQQQQLLTAIKQIEKRTFPTSEAFAFDEELKKRNTTLICATTSSTDDLNLVAYAVYARTKRTALLHKICVVERYRREGVGRSLLTNLRDELILQGCETIQLWVDAAREPARLLYAECGYEEAQRVDDYYGPGRTGVKMIVSLHRGMRG